MIHDPELKAALLAALKQRLARGEKFGMLRLPPCGCKTECFEEKNPQLPSQRECQKKRD